MGATNYIICMRPLSMQPGKQSRYDRVRLPLAIVHEYGFKKDLSFQ